MPETSRSEDRLPIWEDLTPSEQEQLLTQILLIVATNRPMPRELLRPLPSNFLEALLQAVQQLKNEGMLGVHHKVPERLQRLRDALMTRLGDNRQPTENEVLDAQPAVVRNQVRAQEAMNLRQQYAQEMVAGQQQLAAMQ